MIITKISGGLGNQMFQYAAGRALAVKHNTQLKLDLSYYNNPDIFSRSFVLGNYNIKFDIAQPEDKIKFFNKSFFNKIIEKFKSSYRRAVILEKPFEYYKDFNKIGADAYLDGYWQSEKYFKFISNIVVQEFALKNISEAAKKIIDDIKVGASVSVHVRRADYVNLKFVNDRYGVCPIEYYKLAANKISEKICSPHYYIFSDDVEWVENNLKLNGPVTVVSGRGFKDYEEIIIMSNCKHNIIANSSFSWWGAWLNQNPDKMVIAPKKWLKTDAFDAGYILPSNWIKL